ncbi:ABC transporter permease [Microvirga pudoricolor]|uniref:ABC transporter permease n=1 Tax=Microvirga pudoricolor TaxID=2778729 RepID=UPI00194E2A78|nr:ABC transporter permease [Microvirga pudoricolor]MBM6593108.1 ABC transporter permease [Microvirga pudoricolor]
MYARTGQQSAAFYVLPALLFTAVVFIAPLASVIGQSFWNGQFTTHSYQSVISSTLFQKVFVNTLVISFSSTFVALLFAYPMAYHMAKQTPRRRAFLMMIVLIPFWTSILVKSYALMIILGRNGIINTTIEYFGIPALPLLFNRFGVIVGTIHTLIPFMIFPILNSLLARDPDLGRAAQIMGAGKLRIFLKVTLPLSMPGVAASFLLAAVHTFGFYVTASLLGGRGDLMMANLVDLYTREILDWNMAATIAVLLFILCAVFTLLMGRTRALSTLAG